LAWHSWRIVAPNGRAHIFPRISINYITHRPSNFKQHVEDIRRDFSAMSLSQQRSEQALVMGSLQWPFVDV